MDDEFLNYLLGSETVRRKTLDDEVIRRLDEIESLLKQLVKTPTERKSPLLEQILNKGFVIIDGEEINKNLHPSLFVMPLESNKVLVTFKDTIDLLQLLFEKYKDEIEDKIPRRLLPLFLFLKKSGLIYFDHETRQYKLIK